MSILKPAACPFTTLSCMVVCPPWTGSHIGFHPRASWYLNTVLNLPGVGGITQSQVAGFPWTVGQVKAFFLLVGSSTDVGRDMLFPYFAGLLFAINHTPFSLLTCLKQPTMVRFLCPNRTFAAFVFPVKSSNGSKIPQLLEQALGRRKKGVTRVFISFAG